MWLDKLLSNEIDIKTFKTGLDVLLLKKHKGEDIGYGLTRGLTTSVRS
ncbi:MAG: hypothetical protein IMZ58_08050 [Thermoplasmata archaeon]|nr:hypothetical protein [Thermoplasmata archaeon]